MSIRFPELPLQVFIVAVPTMVLAAYGWSSHDACRVMQIGVLLVGALLLFIGSWMRPRPASTASLTCGALLGALTLASVAASAVPSMAWREVALALGLIGMTLIAASGLAEGGQVTCRRLGLSVVAGSALYAFLLSLLALSPLFDGHTLVWPSLAVGYDNYRFFNHVQVIALPLLALQAQDARLGRQVRAAAWFAIVVFWAFVICSGARGTALAMIVAPLVCVPFLGLRTVGPVARTLAIGAVGGAIAYAVVFFLLPAWGGYKVLVAAERTMASLSSDSSRLHLWHIAMSQITESPLLGVGPMHYSHYPNPKAAHPHNAYLQVAAEWGVPMLLLLLAMTGRGLWRMAKAIRLEAAVPRRVEGGALFMTLLAILVDALVSGNFVMPVSQMWIVLCVAWSLAWLRAAKDGGHATTGRDAMAMAAGRALALIILASQVWLVSAIWPEAADLQAHLDHVGEMVGDANAKPRFWSQGRF